jgi:hypothetical protein
MSPCKTRSAGLRFWLVGLLLACGSGTVERGSSGAGASPSGGPGSGGSGSGTAGSSTAGSSGANAGGSAGDTTASDGSPSCTFQGTYQLELRDAELSKINPEECSVIACADNLCSEFLCTPGDPVTRCTSGDLLLLENGALPAECATLRDQIGGLLVAQVQAGVLLGSAVPCGPDGIAAHPEDFAVGTSADVVESVSGDFAARCQGFVDCVTPPAATP